MFNIYLNFLDGDAKSLDDQPQARNKARITTLQGHVDAAASWDDDATTKPES